MLKYATSFGSIISIPSVYATFTVVIQYLPAVASLASGSILLFMKPVRAKRYKRFVSLKPTEILSQPIHR